MGTYLGMVWESLGTWIHAGRPLESFARDSGASSIFVDPLAFRYHLGAGGWTLDVLWMFLAFANGGNREVHFCQNGAGFKFDGIVMVLGGIRH